MPRIVQHRRTDTTSMAGITGAEGELFVDTSKSTVVVMDGITTGGTPLATESYVVTNINEINSSLGVINSTKADLENPVFSSSITVSSVVYTNFIQSTTSNAILDIRTSATTTSAYINIQNNTRVSGTVNIVGDVYYNNGAIIASDGAGAYNNNRANSSVTTNVDHLWHNDSTNVWHFCSDTWYKNQGNSGIVGGKLGIGTSSVGATGEIRATNNITAYYSSDQRLKENIEPIANALDKVKSLTGVMFDWKDEYLQQRGGIDDYFVTKHDTGLIAQQVEQVLPEIVKDRPDGFKGIQYDKLAGLLVEAIKELSERLDKLEGR